MRSLTLKIFGLPLVVGATCALIVVMSSAHWWKKLSAQVVYDGQNLPNANVYRSPGGELLVSLPERSDERALFVVYPAENKIGMPNERHFFFLPGYVFSRHVPPQVVFVNDPVKAGIDPKLQLSSRSVEFFTLTGRKVQIVTD